MVQRRRQKIAEGKKGKCRGEDSASEKRIKKQRRQLKGRKDGEEEIKAQKKKGWEGGEESLKEKQ